MVGAQFKARNIDFMLNDVVESFPESDSGEIVLKSGQTVHSDLIVSHPILLRCSPIASTSVLDQVRTSGPRPNTEILASSLGADILTEGKFVHVSPQLQVFGHPSVFAAGDIIDWPEEKQFGKTVGQAAVVAANIISYLANKPLSKEYTGGPEAIILTNGKVQASASFFPLSDVTDCLCTGDSLLAPPICLSCGDLFSDRGLLEWSSQKHSCSDLCVPRWANEGVCAQFS